MTSTQKKKIISWFIEHKIFYCYKYKNLINIDIHLQIHLIYKTGQIFN